MTNATKHTVVEEGTEIEGSVRSQVPIQVSGAIKGDLAAPSLTVSSSGSVRGNVKVTELRSEGEIAGKIEADRVQLSGRVSDQTSIRATTLEVKLAQQDGKLEVTFGNVDLHVGDRPATVVKVEEPKAEPKAEAKADAKHEEPKGNNRNKRAET
jgi:cytoskeletal protein CcmA (bactofilin family)